MWRILTMTNLVVRGRHRHRPDEPCVAICRIIDPLLTVCLSLQVTIERNPWLPSIVTHTISPKNFHLLCYFWLAALLLLASSFTTLTSSFATFGCYFNYRPANFATIATSLSISIATFTTIATSLSISIATFATIATGPLLTLLLLLQLLLVLC